MRGRNRAPALFVGNRWEGLEEKKKVLYVASSFGHLAAFHQPYFAWLAAQGYEVHAAAGGEVRALQGVSRSISLPFEKSMFSPKNFRAARQLNRLLREEEYCFISLHTALAAFFARLAAGAMGKKRPIVMNTSHGYLFDENTSRIKRMLLLGAERMTAPQTDWLLTMNGQDEAIARRYHLGRRLVQTPGMGIDLERFTPPTPAEKEQLRKAFGFAADARVLVYAGEFSARKHQATLIKGMQQLPRQVVLLLPGSGALLEECKALAAQLGVDDRVRFPGFAHDMERYYRAADICVSSSRIEGLPFNIMEAMACGLPVVASDIKGHQDLVRVGENGLLYPFDDTDAFAAAVQQLADADTRCRMGAASIGLVQKYGLQSVFPELTACYQKALDSAEQRANSI